MTGNWSSRIVLLGLSWIAAEAGPLSSSGCACKSGCDKSWRDKLRSAGNEWCYVETKCKATGWDSCHDTQILYESALNGKKKAEQESFTERLRREEAEKHEGESNGRVASLRKQLESELQKEASITNSLEKAHRQAGEADRETAAANRKVAEADRKAADVERKLKQMEGLEHDAEAKINEKEKALAQAISKEQDTEKKLHDAEQNLHDSSTNAKAVLEEQLAQKEIKLHGSELKLHGAELKQHEAEVKQHQIELKLSDAQLKQAAVDKKLKTSAADARDANTKLESVTKALLELKATSAEQLAVANEKLAASERKAAEETLMERSEATRLQEIESQQADMKSKLQVAEKKKRQADAELKPFRLAVRKAVKSN